jgi:hypothetical protein
VALLNTIEKTIIREKSWFRQYAVNPPLPLHNPSHPLPGGEFNCNPIKSFNQANGVALLNAIEKTIIREKLWFRQYAVMPQHCI